MAAKKRRRRKALLWLLLVLLAALAALVVAVKYWVGPAVIRSQMQAQLAQSWDGESSLEHVEFNYTAPLVLRGLTLRDMQGREWVHIGTITLSFRHWPSPKPVITKVAVDGLDLTTHWAGGATSPPLLKVAAQEKPAAGEGMDLQHLAIRNISFSVVSASGPSVTWKGLDLTVERQGEQYRVALRREVEEPSERLSMEGLVNLRSNVADLAIHLSHTVTPQESAAFIAALEVPDARSIGGTVVADVTIKGPLSSVDQLDVRGMVTLRDGALAGASGPLLQGVAADVELAGEQVLRGNLKARTFSGNVEGVLQLKRVAEEPFEYHGSLTATDIDLAELTRVLEAGEVTEGRLSAKCKFVGRGPDYHDARVNGIVLVTESELLKVPLLSHIVGVLDITDATGADGSEVVIRFSMKGPEVTIEQGNLASNVIAFEAQPGGTVNLETEHLDVYVIAVPIKQVRSIVKSIPLINLLVNVRDKLTRLHIVGRWSDPPVKLVKKEPLTDVREATVGFLRDVVDSGGHLGAGVIKGTQDALKQTEERLGW